MSKKLSRLESNKEIRRVLSRHGVDLAYTQYSCTGMEVRLTGYLIRFDGSAYNGTQVEHLIQDIQRFLKGFYIVGDFDNWQFTSDHITYLGDKEGVKRSSSGDEGEQVIYYIDEDDYKDVG